MTVPYKEIADDIETNGAGIPGADYEAEFARMSVETKSAKRDIPTSEIISYIMLTDDWLPIKRGTTDAAEMAIDALNHFPAFRIAEPDNGAAIEEKLNSMLDALVADDTLVFTEADKAAVLALGISTELKWPGLRKGHINQAIIKRKAGEI